MKGCNAIHLAERGKKYTLDCSWGGRKNGHRRQCVHIFSISPPPAPPVLLLLPLLLLVVVPLMPKRGLCFSRVPFSERGEIPIKRFEFVALFPSPCTTIGTYAASNSCGGGGGGGMVKLTSV